MRSIAVTSFSFQYALENQFNKALEEFDTILTQIQNDVEREELNEKNLLEKITKFTYSSREKLLLMSEAWILLVNKAQTIFEVNCKQEAQLVDMKQVLASTKAFKNTSERERKKVDFIIELISAQFEIQRPKSAEIEDSHVNSFIASDSENASFLVRSAVHAGEVRTAAIDSTDLLAVGASERSVEICNKNHKELCPTSSSYSNWVIFFFFNFKNVFISV